MKIVCETERLTIRHARESDSDFIQDLVNEELWLRFIGDRNIHDREGARRYIQRTMVASYRDNGFGLWLVEHRHSRVPLGICGFLRREEFDNADLGFAIAREHRRKGYAREAALAVIDYGKGVLGFHKILAIAVQENNASLALLRKLGFGGCRPHTFGNTDQPVVVCTLKTGQDFQVA